MFIPPISLALPTHIGDPVTNTDFPVALTERDVIGFNPYKEHNLIVGACCGDSHKTVYEWCSSVLKKMQEYGFVVTSIQGADNEVDVSWSDTVYSSEDGPLALDRVLNMVRYRERCGFRDIQVLYVSAVEDYALGGYNSRESRKRRRTWETFTEILSEGPNVGVFVVASIDANKLPEVSTAGPISSRYGYEMKWTLKLCEGEVQTFMVDSRTPRVMEYRRIEDAVI